MSEQTTTDEEVIEIEPDEAIEPGTDEAAPDGDDSVNQEAQDHDEVEITIGDDSPAEEAPATVAPWVSNLRKRNRDAAKRIAELEAMLKTTTAAPEPIIVGKEPEMGDADIDYDADKFKARWREWNERKLSQERAESDKAEVEKKAALSWQQTVQTYDRAKTALKVKDFAASEDATREALSVVQQGIILQGAKDVSAALVYALGKSPSRLAKLAEIQDPVEFAVAIGEAKAFMKTTPKKAIPKPEGSVRGASVAAAAVGSGKIDALFEKAQKTGDYTEWSKARRAQKDAKKK
jgi:hypothetical protein